MRQRGRNRFVRWLLPLLALLTIVSSAAAQEDLVFTFDFGTVGLDTLKLWSPSSVYRPVDMLNVRGGARAWGMGGAYVAGAEGLEAIAWNPAGLGWLERTDLQADLVWLRSSAATSGFPDTFQIPEISTINVSRYRVNLKSGVHYSALGGAMRVTPLEEMDLLGDRNLRSAIGLSLRRYLDVAYPEEIVEDLNFAEGGSFPVTIAMDGKEEGGVDAATATLALAFGRTLAVGANLNFLTGRLNGTIDSEVQTGGTQAVTGGTRLRFDYEGFSTDLGAQLRSPEFTVFTPLQVGFGVRYTPAYTLEVTNGLFHSRSLAAPGMPTIVVQAKIAGYDMEVPPLLTVGGNLKFSERLTIAVDFSQQNWSEADLTYRDKTRTGKPELPLLDVTNLNIGAEAHLVRIKGVDVPLRVGYREGPLSVAQLEPHGNVLQGDWMGGEIQTSAVSFGTGLLSGPLRWDVAYEFLDYKLKKFYFDAPWDALVNPESTIVDVDRRISRLRLSATLGL